MTDLTLESLAERVHHLERQNRVLRAVVIVAIAVLAAIGCQGRARVSKVVEAQEFVLRDRDGRARLEMAMDEKGRMPVVHLRDEKRYVRAGLSLVADGTPRLWFADEKGKVRVWLSPSPVSNVGPSLGLIDEKGKTRVDLGLVAHGSPRLSFYDDEGKVLWNAPPD